MIDRKEGSISEVKVVFEPSTVSSLDLRNMFDKKQLGATSISIRALIAHEEESGCGTPRISPNRSRQ